MDGPPHGIKVISAGYLRVGQKLSALHWALAPAIARCIRDLAVHWARSRSEAANHLHLVLDV